MKPRPRTLPIFGQHNPLIPIPFRRPRRERSRGAPSLRRAAAKLRARGRATLPLDADAIVEVEPRSPDLDRAVRLERALAELPAGQREVIALKVDGGLTFAEVAACLGVSPNTAASRYR